MKNFLLSALIVALIFMTGCGSDASETKVGTIRYSNMTEESFDRLFNENNTPTIKKRKHIFFDNMGTMIAAMHAGQIEGMNTYNSVASFISVNNPQPQWIVQDSGVSDAFCCALREEEVALKKEFDIAIQKMTLDGTLSKLVKAYIGKVNHGDILNAVELPHFDGAETIKVGVTGDLPPIDYVRADGLPEGFNTAILAEISRIIKKNFELVQIDSGARAAALTSKQVDVIFWAVAPKNYGNLPANFDTPDGVILTESYFSDKIVFVKEKK